MRRVRLPRQPVIQEQPMTTTTVYKLTDHNHQAFGGCQWASSRFGYSMGRVSTTIRLQGVQGGATEPQTSHLNIHSQPMWIHREVAGISRLRGPAYTTSRPMPMADWRRSARTRQLPEWELVLLREVQLDVLLGRRVRAAVGTLQPDNTCSLGHRTHRSPRYRLAVTRRDARA